MKNKIIQFIPAVLAIVAIGFLYFSQWCIPEGHACFQTFLDRIFIYLTSPIYFFALYFLPIAIILAFVQREIFKSWLKLIVWIIPLLVLYIWTTPVWNNSLLPFNRDDAARLAGQVFATLSLVLIVWKYFSARRARLI